MSFALPTLDFAWRDLFAALSLYLVLEGVLPFLSPGGARRAFARLSTLTHTQLRVAGLISMLIGLGLLYAIRH